MCKSPEVRMLSLFVPDLAAATERYGAVLGLEPAQDPGLAPQPHPFAESGPIVFQLGPVALALYQATPSRGTHPGDVGIGLAVDDCVRQVAARAAANGGSVFFGPERLPEDGREMAVFMLPDRHFFELLEQPTGRPDPDQRADRTSGR